MKIKLKTLSPVHIGSGTQYEGNAEYLFFPGSKELVILDELKVLKIIGPENVYQWVNFIEKREDNFLDFLKKHKPDLEPEDIAKRVIALKGTHTPRFSNTLREQIHTGSGVPYLPGSSMKGSIRTAIFTNYLMNKYERNGLDQAKLGWYNKRKKKFSYSDQSLQKEVFGGNPNKDWLRILRVGDCHFPKRTSAAFSETLNETGYQEYSMKHSVKQLVEFIPTGSTGEFQITVAEDLLESILQKNPRYFSVGKKDANLPALFQLIHKHYRRLLENEIEFFKDVDLPPEVDYLKEFLDGLLEESQSFDQHECLLRLGFGTGFRNMTGDWVRFLVSDDNLLDEISTEARRNSRYNHMPLPKSRKVMFDGMYMGYVKLTMEN